MRALLYLTVLLLLGCNREASSPKAESAPPPARPQHASRQINRAGWPVIVAYGDSLTAGFGVEPGKSYPDDLQKLLDENGYRYRVVNEGVSGDTTTDGLARLDQVIADKPQIAILELGGNDGLRGLPPKAIYTNLDRMIAGLQKAGATVLLCGMTLPPNYGADYIGPFEQNYRTLATKHRVAFLPFLLQGVPEGGMMQQDGIHATVEGNERVAKNVFNALKPLLRKS